MKKIVLSLVLLNMIVPLFIACKNPNTPDTSNDSNKESNAQEDKNGTPTDKYKKMYGHWIEPNNNYYFATIEEDKINYSLGTNVTFNLAYFEVKTVKDLKDNIKNFSFDSNKESLILSKLNDFFTDDDICFFDKANCFVVLQLTSESKLKIFNEGGENVYVLEKSSSGQDTPTNGIKYSDLIGTYNIGSSNSQITFAQNNTWEESLFKNTGSVKLLDNELQINFSLEGNSISATYKMELNEQILTLTFKEGDKEAVAGNIFHITNKEEFNIIKLTKN